MKFCPKCGASVQMTDQFCSACGAPLQVEGGSPAPQSQGCSFIVTLILCICCGGWGIHRFYTKSAGIGVLQLLTCGGLGIWTFIDLITILTGSYRDGEGHPLVRDY